MCFQHIKKFFKTMVYPPSSYHTKKYKEIVTLKKPTSCNPSG